MARLTRVFTEENVLDAARARIELLFDNFEEIIVSISAGKDSTVLYHLCVQEAIRRNRKIIAFFLDQEAEYQASIDLIKDTLREGIAKGAFRKVDVDHIAEFFYSIYVMFIIKTYVKSEGRSAQKMFDKGLDLLLQGLIKK